MGKIVIGTAIAFLILLTGSGSVFADGVIIPDSSVGYPVIKYHDVTVTVEKQHAETVVDQEFYNPYDEEMVGTYIFPVPEGAFISNFTVIIDGVECHAESLSREEAKEFFEQAVDNHEDVSLLEYMDQNLFAVRVTIPPKGHKQMGLRYGEFLIPWGGMYRYAYTLSTERYSSADIENVSVTVNISSDKGVQNVYSPTHDVVVERLSSTEVRVQYLAQNVRPDKDFELYYTTSENSFGAGWLNYFDGEQGFFLFTFSPDPDDFKDRYVPKDIVFVIDKSGSMSGEKIVQAKEALKFILQQLGENDRFMIVSFNHNITELSDELMAVNSANISEALSYVDSLSAGGNTNINGALLDALDVLGSSTSPGSAKIIVFLTDGLPTAGVANEDQIAANVENANITLEVEASIYVFGVGYDVNTHLLDKLSTQNHGFSIYVDPGESLEEALVTFYGGIENPILTDISVTFSGVDVSEVYPREVPDLFEGSQIVLVGKYSKAGDMVVIEASMGDNSGKLQREYVTYKIVRDHPSGENIVTITAIIRGDTTNGPMELTYEFELTYADCHDFIPRLWATRKVGDLVSQIRLEGETEELVENIKELGVKYGIVTPYTSMLIRAGAGTAAEYLADGYNLKVATGRVAFGAAEANLQYNNALSWDVAQGANIEVAGRKTFVDLDGILVDMSLLENVTAIDLENQTAEEWVLNNVQVAENVRFGSDKYFALAGDGGLEEELAAGTNLVFVHDGKVLHVSGDVFEGPSSSSAYPAGEGTSNIATVVGVLMCLGLATGLGLFGVLRFLGRM
ncbi:MAG: VIT domain-containing protein [Candidatus Hadarchaeota archaeon]|nr:VIT domain-containing protein [Candidatus Hadarchaeota archaeon]